MSGGRHDGLKRRTLLGGALALAPFAAAAQQPPRPPVAPARTPIVFVHGNGDSGALWINNLWRFEANGWTRDQLFAIDFSYPTARREDAKAEPFRSSAAEQAKELADHVARVRQATGRDRVALVGSSRGGNAIRSFLANGGATAVSHAVLCGTPNKGIVNSDSLLVGSEFNGAYAFLKGLNAGPDDLVPGVAMMAIRSDTNDKYAQPDGRFIGAPGKSTGVGYDAAELRGARNVTLDGLDHREVAFHKLAFAAMYEFIAGIPPATLFIAQEPLPVLNGKVTGIADGTYTNLPVGDAEVEVYEVDAKTGERRSSTPAHRKVTGPDGAWGPFVARAETYYEFVLRMAAQPITHTYRSPFLRSSDLVHLRPAVFGKGDETAGAVVAMSRPRGYFGVGRDKFSLDGKTPPGITDGVPGVSTGKLAFDTAPRTVLAVLNTETIPARTWPVKDNHLVIAEFLN
ncbi:MAG: alpha/beta fold hydrolase [Proteobacteria bacterium]|nr:alpha/beta fold hydrolase [Pseudomonadota bacterium]